MCFATWWENWPRALLVWIWTLILFSVGVYILFVLVIKILSIFKLLVRHSRIRSLILLIIPWSLWWPLVYNFNISIINIRMICHPLYLLTIFGNILIALLIWMPITIHIIICLPFKRVVVASIGWSPWMWLRWMLSIISIFTVSIFIILFIITVSATLNWCLNHHVTRGSGLSFLSSRNGGKIIWWIMSVSIIRILIIDSWHLQLFMRF